MKISSKLFLLLIVSSFLFKSYSLKAYTGEVPSSPVYGNEVLPDWIFENNAVIGISDTQMDSIDAVNQAVNRALAFYAIGNKLNIGSVYELYYLLENDNHKSADNQKSHWMAVINAELNNYDYQINNIYYSQYKEVFVSLSVYYDKNSKKQMSVCGKLMFYYDYLNNSYEYGESDSLAIYTPSESVKYSLWSSKIDGGKCRKESICDGNIISVVDYGYKYSNKGSYAKSSTFAQQRYGFWNAYFDTFFQAVTNFESNITIIKKTSQSITAEYDSYQDKNQNIVRSIVKTKVSCRHNAISLKDKFIYIDWKIEEE